MFPGKLCSFCRPLGHLSTVVWLKYEFTRVHTTNNFRCGVFWNTFDYDNEMGQGGSRIQESPTHEVGIVQSLACKTVVVRDFQQQL